MPMRMSVSVSVSGHGILADYLLGQGETSTCFTGLDMFQATPSAKTEWRQESGYSQHILSLKDNPHRLVHPRPKTSSILQVEVARLRDSVTSKVEKLALDAEKPTPD